MMPILMLKPLAAAVAALALVGCASLNPEALSQQDIQAQSQADLVAGRFVAESAQAHAARLSAMLVASEPAPGQSKPTQKTAPRRKG